MARRFSSDDHGFRLGPLGHPTQPTWPGVSSDSQSAAGRCPEQGFELRGQFGVVKVPVGDGGEARVGDQIGSVGQRR